MSMLNVPDFFIATDPGYVFLLHQEVGRYLLQKFSQERTTILILLSYKKSLLIKHLPRMYL